MTPEPDHPSGTVTFLFTDIESSSSRWEADAAEMRTTLARHDQVLSSVIEESGGFVFKHLGDGVCAAFPSASAALKAAVDGQAGLTGEGWGGDDRLRVRMGLHTGEASPTGGDYFGPPVNRAARVMGVANGGQIVCSAATAGLCPEVEFRDAGVHELAGIGPEHLFVSVHDPGDDRPLRSSSAASPSNLVSALDSFVGRSRDVDELGELLVAQELVTLVGVGGVGKTRLATETAAKMSSAFPNGVWLCELAGAGSADSVAAIVAEVLGATPQPGVDLIESIAVFLERRRVVVILDNCEHVLSAAAVLARRLAKIEGTTVLATSRELLGVQGEQVWPVSPLEATTGAVELFLARARERDPQFTADGDNDAAAIANICVRLDGIPLAIELAAARTGALSPVVLAERLSDRFRLLRGGRRGERHQTLRDTVRWSYELLDEAERCLFRRLSVFAGGFNLPAAERVCSDGELVDEFDVIDLVSSLVDKSMVQRDPSNRDRYSMLETLRQFGDDELDSHGEATDTRLRHADYFRDLAVDEYERSQGPDEAQAWQVLDLEWENLRGAYDHAMATDGIDLAADIVTSLFFYAHSAVRHELGAWADALLDLGIAHHPRYGPLCGISGSFAFERSDYELARHRVEQHFASDSVDIDYCHASMVPAYALLGDVSGADQVSQRMLDLANQQNRLRAIVNANGARMIFGRVSGDWDLALRHADVGLAAARKSQIPSLLGITRHQRGMAQVRTDPEQSMAEQRSVMTAINDDANMRFFSVVATMGLAEAAVETDNVPTALSACRHAVARSSDTRSFAYLTTSLEHTAVALTKAGEPEIAAQLLGCTSDQPHRTPVRHQRIVAEALGDAFQHHLDKGTTLTLLDAAELAITTIDRLQQDQPSTG